MEKFKYQVNNLHPVVVKYYYGPITLQDIFLSWKHAFDHKLIPDGTKGFILDYRGGTIDVSIDEYEAIPEFYKRHLDVFGNSKIAVLTESPSDIVIPNLVATKDEGFTSRPFSTLEAAYKWVLN